MTLLYLQFKISFYLKLKEETQEKLLFSYFSFVFKHTQYSLLKTTNISVLFNGHYISHYSFVLLFFKVRKKNVMLSVLETREEFISFSFNYSQLLLILQNEKRRKTYINVYND